VPQILCSSRESRLISALPLQSQPDMKFDNSFTVPVPPAEAWPLLLDVPTIAPCLPGAEITEVLGERKYRGRAKAKIGPLLLTFNGEAEIVAVDDAAQTAKVMARGNDEKGRGSASAAIDFALAPDPAGSRVAVSTELNLAGSVAQYGRGTGMMNSIASQLISQFAKNLETMIRAAAGEKGMAAPDGKPIAGLRLVGGALKDAMVRKFGRGSKN
jgi:carbon monoxide dehydrogenase subunit G